MAVERIQHMPSPIVGITADDLTGAADTAAALARPGAPVSVSLGPQPRGARLCPAFAVNTDSRARSPDDAYRVVHTAVQALRAAGAALIYKKTDSNLRGNIGPELAAVAEALGRPVLFCPAFPARRRTVAQGVVLINGIPVAETEIAHDPEQPVVCSHIVDLIRQQRPGLALSHLPLADLRQGAHAVGRHIPEAGVLVLDAETDHDLDLIAEAALSLSPLPALAGSAGLAAALGRRLFGPAPPVRWPETEAGPVLAVLATASAALTKQIECAAALTQAQVIPVLCEKMSPEEGPMPELRQAAVEAVGALASGRDAVLYAAGPLPSVERPVELVVEHLAHLAFVVVNKGRPRALLVGGGSTAQRVLEALAAEAIKVDDEPETGIAAGVVAGGHLDDVPVALKPGAAGDERVIVRLLGYLRRRAAVI